MVEVLIALLVMAVAAIAGLSYFSHGLGGIGREGNRRAALERARERMEQLMAADVAELEPPDMVVYWLQCSGSPCLWTLSSAAPAASETVSVDDLPAQKIETTVRWVDDPAAQTTGSEKDVLELGVKVWFTSESGSDDEFNRVHIRTLRSP